MVDLLNQIDADVAIFLATSLFAFMAWMVKGLIGSPLAESRETFYKFFEKRIEVLTEIKVRLGFIAYFPKEDESKEFKEQIQTILLKDGKAAYLSKETFEDLLRISVEPATSEKLVLKIIAEIDADLYSQISKVRDELWFYKRFSIYDPLKRFFAITSLLLQYILSLSLVIGSLIFITYGLMVLAWYWKVVIILLALIGLYVVGRWMRK